MSNAACIASLGLLRRALIAIIRSSAEKATEIPPGALSDVIADERRARKDVSSRVLRRVAAGAIRTARLGDNVSANTLKWLDSRDLGLIAVGNLTSVALKALAAAYGEYFGSDEEMDQFLRGVFGPSLSPIFVPPRESLPTPRQLLSNVLRFVDVEDFIRDIGDATAILDTTALDKYERKPGFGRPGVVARVTKYYGGYELASDLDEYRVIDVTLGILGAVTIESHAIAGHLATGLRVSEITARCLGRDNPIAEILLPTELRVRKSASQAAYSLFAKDGALECIFAWTFKGVEALANDALVKHTHMGPELQWLRRKRDAPWVRDLRGVVVRAMRRCSRSQAHDARQWASQILGSGAASDGDVEGLATYVLASATRHGKWSCNDFTAFLVSLRRLDWRRSTLAASFRSVSAALATSVSWPQYLQYFPSAMGTMEVNRGIYYGI